MAKKKSGKKRVVKKKIKPAARKPAAKRKPAAPASRPIVVPGAWPFPMGSKP